MPAVQLGELVDRSGVPGVEFEEAASGLGQIGVIGAVPGGVDLDMGVEVDRSDGAEVDGALIPGTGHVSCRRRS